MKISDVNSMLPDGAKLKLEERENLMMGSACIFSDNHRREMTRCLSHIGAFLSALEQNGYTITRVPL